MVKKTLKKHHYGNVLRKKVVREIRTSYLQYLSVIMIAMLAVTLFTGIFANYKNFDDRVKKVYEETNMCDIVITYSEHDEKDEKYLQEKYFEYERRIYFTGLTENVGFNAIVFDENTKMNVPTDISVDKITLDDVLVDNNLLKKRNIKIGDTIAIEFNSISIDLKITGTMVHPEALDNSTYGNGLIYIGYNAMSESLKEKFGLLGTAIINNMYTQYIIKCADNSEKNLDNYLDDINDYFLNKENNNLLFAVKRSNLPTNVSIESDVIQAKKMLYVFPVIFYLVAILIILTSISQLINKERMNIGIMKSFGYTRSEILKHYMTIAIVLCLIGSIIGIILGPAIIPEVMNTKYKYLYQLPQYKVPFVRFEYLYSVIILILVSVVASYAVCKGEINKKPIESLRGENSIDMKPILIEKTHLFKKIPLTIRMALRNMRRKISRTLMVVLGLLGCSSLLVCGFGIDNTLNYGLNLEIDELIAYDISVSYKNATFIKDELTKISGIEQVDEYAKLNVTLQGKNAISSYLYLLSNDGNIFSPDYHKDGALVSKKVANEIGINVGDEIKIIYNNTLHIKKVVDIVELCITQGVFISEDNIDIEFKPTASWIRISNSDLSDSVNNEIKELANVSSTMTRSEMHERADSVTSAIRLMTLTIKTFAILLAVVVLYNLALLNFEERTKDIATLKVLGFTRTEIGTSLTFEILVSTLIGSLIGLIFGKPLLVLVMSINENPLLSYIYHIDAITYLYTILLTCGVSILINTIFAFLTKNVKMVESLKSVD